MNKSLLALLLGVCVAGMCLLMYQETQESPRPAKPAQADAASDRRAGLPVPRELSAVPVPPQAGRPATPVQAGRSAGTPPLANTPVAGTRPTVPPQERESGEGKAKETALVVEKNSGGEKAPAAEKTPVAEKAPVVPAEARPAPFAASPAQQAAHAPAVPVPPDAPAASPGQPVSAARAAGAAPRPDVDRNAKLVVFARDKGATVRLTDGKPVRYQTMTLSDPDRVVVDVEGVAGLKAPGVPKNPVVSNVRLGAIGGKTRIVIDLTGKPGHTRFVLSQEKDRLDIRIDQ
ncbi:MAG: AMIN domain-containing protein [Desulfovibrio sp.]|jgi:hypothetical protein|nr:AMIN domain-containing protein [Desulfovibrio sp.]